MTNRLALLDPIPLGLPRLDDAARLAPTRDRARTTESLAERKVREPKPDRADFADRLRKKRQDDKSPAADDAAPDEQRPGARATDPAAKPVEPPVPALSDASTSAYPDLTDPGQFTPQVPTSDPAAAELKPVIAAPPAPVSAVAQAADKIAADRTLDIVATDTLKGLDPARLRLVPEHARASWTAVTDRARPANRASADAARTDSTAAADPSLASPASAPSPANTPSATPISASVPTTATPSASILLPSDSGASTPLRTDSSNARSTAASSAIAAAANESPARPPATPGVVLNLLTPTPRPVTADTRPSDPRDLAPAGTPSDLRSPARTTASDLGGHSNDAGHAGRDGQHAGTGRGGSASAAQALLNAQHAADPALASPALAPQLERAVLASMNALSGAVTLRLNPASLGQVRVSVAIDRGSGAVAAKFDVASPKAAGAITAALNGLRTSLESRGIDVRGLDVRVDPDSAAGVSFPQRDPALPTLTDSTRPDPNSPDTHRPESAASAPTPGAAGASSAPAPFNNPANPDAGQSFTPGAPFADTESASAPRSHAAAAEDVLITLPNLGPVRVLADGRLVLDALA